MRVYAHLQTYDALHAWDGLRGRRVRPLKAQAEADWNTEVLSWYVLPTTRSVSASYAPVYGFIRESAGRHGLAPEFLQTVVFGEGVARALRSSWRSRTATLRAWRMVSAFGSLGLDLILYRVGGTGKDGESPPAPPTELPKPVLTADGARSWPSTTFNLVDAGYVDQATADAVEFTEEFPRTEGGATRTIQLADVHGWDNGIELIAAELHARLDEMIAYLASKSPPVPVADELSPPLPRVRPLQRQRRRRRADHADALGDATRALARVRPDEQPDALYNTLQRLAVAQWHEAARVYRCTTVADIEGRELTPLSELLAAADVPGDLVARTTATSSRCSTAFTDATLQPVENGYLGDVVARARRRRSHCGRSATPSSWRSGRAHRRSRAELALEARPAGFGVGAGRCSTSRSACASTARSSGPLLPGTTEPDPRATSLDLVARERRRCGSRPSGPSRSTSPAPAAVPRCMIGETGDHRQRRRASAWLTPGSEDLPGGTPADFAGLHLQDVVLELASLELAPDAELRIDSAFVGRGGVTADVALEGLDLAGSLAGFAFTLDSLDLTVVQNGVTGSAVAGTLQVPFFEQPVDVAVSLSGDGGLHVSLAGLGPDGLAGACGAGPWHARSDRPRARRLRRRRALLLSGRLEVTAGAPTLQWPIVALRDLGVDTAGHVTLAGGWLDLQEPLALDLYGFGMEITRVGFGTEEDGRRWFGVDGAMRLTELLPAGASARGLRVTLGPGPPGALPAAHARRHRRLRSGCPTRSASTGEVALADDPNGDGEAVHGRARARPRRARRRDRRGHHDRPRRGGHVRVRAISASSVPIPMAATGTALYGLEGLFAMNMSPLVATGAVDADGSTVQRGDWYGWYKHVPEPFSVTDPTKWSPEHRALGVRRRSQPRHAARRRLRGEHEGAARRAAARTGDPAPGHGRPPEGAGRASAAARPRRARSGCWPRSTAAPARSQLGIDAAWSVPRMLDIAASTDAFFDFDRARRLAPVGRPRRAGEPADPRRRPVAVPRRLAG